MLTVDHTDAGYGRIQVLRDVSLKVPEKRIATLLGANGAGKSTLLKTISGMIPARRGRIEFCGADITTRPTHWIVRAGLCLTPEGRELFAERTVGENLDLGAYTRKDRKRIAADRDRLLGLFRQLAGMIRRRAGTLSGGEQQMLTIARALMARPTLLMLDEPTLGMAPFLVDEIFRVLKQLNDDGLTLLLVEQNACRALAISHYGYLMENGRIAMGAEAKELEKNNIIQKAYLGEI